MNDKIIIITLKLVNESIKISSIPIFRLFCKNLERKSNGDEKFRILFMRRIKKYYLRLSSLSRLHNFLLFIFVRHWKKDLVCMYNKDDGEKLITG